MNPTKTLIKDFVIVSRKIRNDYSNGKITLNEFFVLLWIFLNTNPYSGFFVMSYEGLAQDFKRRISYDSARKIISSLRRKQYIYFLDHKGRKGSFPVYPLDFILTNRKVQTLDYLENKLSITTQSQVNTEPDTKLENNFRSQNHNFEEQKKSLISGFSMNNQDPQITTPYNDNDNKNNKHIDDLNISFKRIDVGDFSPKTYEEERCWKIAKELRETDMRFILSCLKKYGISHIERAWRIFKKIPQEKIRNPRKYFNKLIRNSANREKKQRG